MLQDSPQPSTRPGLQSRNGLSLARNNRRLSRLPFRGQRSRPAASPAGLLLLPPVRPFGSTPESGLPRPRLASTPHARCGFRNLPCLPLPRPPLPFGALTPLRIKAFNRFRCWLSPPSESARFPFAPHSRCLLLAFRLRINVPGPLRFRRLAVPQTSWNLSHYAPEPFFRQRFCARPNHFSSGFISIVFK